VLYEQFTTLFNERVEAFISKAGASLEEFVDACQNVTSPLLHTHRSPSHHYSPASSDTDCCRLCVLCCVVQAGDDVFVVQMILSITSFDEFKVSAQISHNCTHCLNTRVRHCTSHSSCLSLLLIITCPLLINQSSVRT